MPNIAPTAGGERHMTDSHMTDSRAATTGGGGVGAVDEELDRALTGLRDVLGADGYQLDATASGDHSVVVRVVAGPDACADCLVPRPVMEGILADALQATPYTVARVEMPADGA
jgi:hypothetical protein